MRGELQDHRCGRLTGDMLRLRAIGVITGLSVFIRLRRRRLRIWILRRNRTAIRSGRPIANGLPSCERAEEEAEGQGLGAVESHGRFTLLMQRVEQDRKSTR